MSHPAQSISTCSCCGSVCGSCIELISHLRAYGTGGEVSHLLPCLSNGSKLSHFTCKNVNVAILQVTIVPDFSVVNGCSTYFLFLFSKMCPRIFVLFPESTNSRKECEYARGEICCRFITIVGLQGWKKNVYKSHEEICNRK